MTLPLTSPIPFNDFKGGDLVHLRDHRGATHGYAIVSSTKLDHGRLYVFNDDFGGYWPTTGLTVVHRTNLVGKTPANQDRRRVALRNYLATRGAAQPNP